MEAISIGRSQVTNESVIQWISKYVTTDIRKLPRLFMKASFEVSGLSGSMVHSWLDCWI